MDYIFISALGVQSYFEKGFQYKVVRSAVGFSASKPQNLMLIH